jgi:hypothetical protein
LVLLTLEKGASVVSNQLNPAGTHQGATP